MNTTTCAAERQPFARTPATDKSCQVTGFLGRHQREAVRRTAAQAIAYTFHAIAAVL